MKAARANEMTKSFAKIGFSGRIAGQSIRRAVEWGQYSVTVELGPDVVPWPILTWLRDLGYSVETSQHKTLIFKRRFFRLHIYW